MSIIKRPDSPYLYMEITDPRTGKPFRKSTGTANRKEAERRMAEEIRLLNDHRLTGTKGTITLAEALENLRVKKEAEGKRWNVDNGAKKLTGQMKGRKGLKPDMLLHTIDTGDIERIKLWRAKEKLATSTINGELKVLSAAIRLAKRMKYLAPDLDGLEFDLDPPESRWRPLTPEEEVAILAHLDPDKPLRWKDRFGNEGVTTKFSPEMRRARQDAYDLTIFLLDTGARYNEVASLTWAECIDTVTWTWVDIYRWKVENSGRLRMTARLREVLQRRWAERRNSAFIFPSPDTSEGDRPRGRSTKAIRRAIKAAGCNEPEKVKRRGRTTVHSFRHTAATRWRKMGMKVEDVMVLLGHSDIKTTMIYFAPDEEDISTRAAAALDAFHAAAGQEVAPSQPGSNPPIALSDPPRDRSASETLRSQLPPTFLYSPGLTCESPSYSPSSNPLGYQRKFWSERQDLNLRPLDPQDPTGPCK